MKVSKKEEYRERTERTGKDKIESISSKIINALAWDRLETCRLNNSLSRQAVRSTLQSRAYAIRRTTHIVRRFLYLLALKIRYHLALLGAIGHDAGTQHVYKAPFLIPQE